MSLPVGKMIGYLWSHVPSGGYREGVGCGVMPYPVETTKVGGMHLTRMLSCSENMKMKIATIEKVAKLLRIC